MRYDESSFMNMTGLLSWFWVAQNLQQTISQCAIDEFASFLRHWISLTLLHNIDYFMLYHSAKWRCVLEIFNCIDQMKFWCSSRNIINFLSNLFRTNFLIDRILAGLCWILNFLTASFLNIWAQHSYINTASI